MNKTIDISRGHTKITDTYFCVFYDCKRNPPKLQKSIVRPSFFGILLDIKPYMYFMLS